MKTNPYARRGVAALTIFKSGKVMQKDPVTPACKGIAKSKFV